jgi:hypothetical protein
VSVKSTFGAKAIADVVRGAVEAQMNREILVLQRSLVLKLSHTGSGRVYRGGRKGKGALRRRSAPGEPPAVDTERLRLSVQTATRGSESNATRVLVYLTDLAPYGKPLDTGIRRIRPRPWITPTLAAHSEKIKERIDAAVQKALAAHIPKALT